MDPADRFFDEHCDLVLDLVCLDDISRDQAETLGMKSEARGRLHSLQKEDCTEVYDRVSHFIYYLSKYTHNTFMVRV